MSVMVTAPPPAPPSTAPFLPCGRGSRISVVRVTAMSSREWTQIRPACRHMAFQSSGDPASEAVWDWVAREAAFGHPAFIDDNRFYRRNPFGLFEEGPALLQSFNISADVFGFVVLGQIFEKLVVLQVAGVAVADNLAETHTFCLS